MRKLAIYTAIALWIIAAFKAFRNNYENSDLAIAYAVSQSNLAGEYSEIQAIAEYGTTYLSIESKEKILKSIANDLGLKDYNIDTIKKDNMIVSSILKDGKNAKTSLKFVTMEASLGNNAIQATQYILLEIDFYSNTDAVLKYKPVIEKSFSKIKVFPKITTTVVSSVQGKKNLKEKNEMVDTMLKELNCRVVTENRTDNLFTVYAYSKEINDSIVVSGKKVNVNIAVNYDEIENKTYIYMATPIYNQDY